MKPLADRLADLRIAVEPCDKEAAALLLEAENAIRAWTVFQPSSCPQDARRDYSNDLPIFAWNQCANPAFLPESWSK